MGNSISAWTTGNWTMSQRKLFSTAPDWQHSGHTGWCQMVLHTRSEERLVASRDASGRQGENSALDRSRIMALYSHALWLLQCSGDLWEVNGGSSPRSHVWFVSCLPGRHDRNWPHIPRAPSQLTESVWAAPRSPPKLNPGKFSGLMHIIQAIYFWFRRHSKSAD
jgi:hypothetical protein